MIRILCNKSKFCKISSSNSQLIFFYAFFFSEISDTGKESRQCSSKRRRLGDASNCGSAAKKATRPQSGTSRSSASPSAGDGPCTGTGTSSNRQARTRKTLSLKPGDTLIGKDNKTSWTVIEAGVEITAKRSAQNIVTEEGGPSPHAKRHVCDGSPYSAWKLFFTDAMLKEIIKCTECYARSAKNIPDWTLSLEELEAVFALMYVRGAYGASKLDYDLLWSREWGPAFFTKTMSRNRFRDILSNLRFDMRSTRPERLQQDKFALISSTWEKFVENCQSCYKPGMYLTGDEQLLPSKCRCRFTQYMPNKPDKFGIKFWVLADAETKYVCNIQPYLGKDDSRPKDESLGEHVILELMKPFQNKGRNITTDNFFTTQKLALRLKEKRTSIVGTVNRGRREIPQQVKVMKEPLHSTILLQSKESTLTVYQGKKQKNVLVLSTMHPSVSIGSDAKKLPETIAFYNSTKAGVDAFDQMARLYTTRAASRRWPMHILYNMLDIAGINSCIIFKQCTKSKLSRHRFLLQLAKEMASKYAGFRSENKAVPSNDSNVRQYCEVKKHCKKNKTCTKCLSCEKFVCGTCSKNVCANCE